MPSARGKRLDKTVGRYLSDTMKEKYLFGMKVVSVTVLSAWIFFDSPIGMISGAVIGPLFLWEYKDDMAKKRKFHLEKQFCTGLSFAAGALEAGYSVENAWKQMQLEVEKLYGRNSDYWKRLKEINQRVSINQSLEILMLDFAGDTNSETIRNFAEVFYFARKSGGNLARIMKRTAERIQENFQILEELQLAIASKKLEISIMKVLPFVILGYLKISSREFLQPLYHNFSGVCVMSACLGLYLMAWIIARRMIQIGV